ncbi:AAA domain-containing protein [Fimicolochytrium jonesii]|uniref:AAA domain-containing protein n=1 Tax=Fimicolochytrium jonesii TaxID=1396493 RepID=UPI0022FE25D5|nr:AAA domain-containing protein [Fimicolochytrium jonesii]KAI8819487.1 AAA domain-containing protein [Fimicolochytrium jonesii]
MLRGEMATKKKGGVQVSTVDAFQGAEKTVILLSTVRTRYVGFIDEPRRVNVALTRAKRHLFIFGNKTLLSRDKLWGKVLAHSCTESGETGTLHPAGFITLLDRIAADVAAADAMA